MTSYAASMLADLAAFTDGHPPGLSPSSVGLCRAKAVLDELVTPQPGGDVLPSVRGTAIHQLWAQARKAGNPHLEHEVKVTVGDPVNLVGTCDEWDPETAEVTDLKTTSMANLARIRVDGPPQHHQFQVALYALGLSVQERPVERVRIVYWPVDGSDGDLWVWECDEWSPIANAAAVWVDEVRERVHEINADHADVALGEYLGGFRDKPAFWCERYCPHIAACRGLATVDDFTDPDVEAAAAEHQRGRALVDAGKAIQAQVRPVLEGRRGRFGDFTVTTSGGSVSEEWQDDVAELKRWWEFSQPDADLPGVRVEKVTPLRLTVRQAKR